LRGVTPAAVPSDVDLVRRCARGDAAAIRVLYDRHGESLLRFLERMLRDRPRAEDVCQEAFLRVWRRAELFDPARGTFTAWLYRAAANLAFNRLALKSSTETELSSQLVLPPAETVNPSEEASRNERSRLLHDALGALSPQDRAILTLRHIEERPVAEIAGILDIPEGTVKSRVHYAMHRLRSVLEPAMGVDPGSPAAPEQDSR